MKNVILYIAMSLDGFIADTSGGVDWLTGQEAEKNEEGSYSDFIESIDTVIMGYRTYHQITTELSPLEWPYSGKQTYVLTHHPYKNEKEISFISEPVRQFIERLQKQEGKNIWICGGADIVKQLITENLIDKYWITIIPVLLGEGIPLFCKRNNPIPLKLISAKSYNGMTDLIYERRYAYPAKDPAAK